MSNIEDKLVKSMQSIGVLNGLEENNNEKDNSNHKSKDKSLDTQDNSDYGIRNTIKEIKKLSKKRKVKNVTYGLYGDQQESIKEIVDELDITANDFMRKNVDMIIDIYKKELGL